MGYPDESYQIVRKKWAKEIIEYFMYVHYNKFI